MLQSPWLRLLALLLDVVMFICYYPRWDDRTGNATLVIGLARAASEREAVRSFATREDVPRDLVGAISLESVAEMVTPNAEAVGPCGGGGTCFFSCLWMAKRHKTRDGEVWAYVFRTKSADQAARNLFLYRFSLEQEPAAEVEEFLATSDSQYTLEEVTAETVSDAVAQHVYHGSGGYADYVVNHCAFDVFDVARQGGRLEIRGTTPEEMVEAIFREWEQRQKGQGAGG